MKSQPYGIDDTDGFMIDIRIQEMVDYFTAMQDVMKDRLSEAQFRVEERLEAISAQHDEVREDLAQDLWYSERLWEEQFPQELYRGLMISCYSFMEHYLTRLCERQQREKHLLLLLDDVRHGGIRRAKTYLTKVAGNTLSGSVFWDEVGLLGSIRNAIVHNDGIVEDGDSKKSLLRYATEHPELIGAEEHPKTKQVRVQVTGRYCEHILQLCRAFFMNLLFDLGYTSSPNGFEAR